MAFTNVTRRHRRSPRPQSTQSKTNGKRNFLDDMNYDLPLVRNRVKEGVLVTRCRLVLHALCRCSLILLILLIIVAIGCWTYVQKMTYDNAHHAKDPCFVAQNSMDTLELLRKSGRQMKGPREIIVTVKEAGKGKQRQVIDTSIKSPDSYTFEFGVPKIIHQQWKNDHIPTKYTKWRDKWYEFFPQSEYQYVLWDDDKGRQLIEDHYPWFLKTYDGYPHNINRVDAARYFILHFYGGVYADLDYEPLMNFFTYLPQNIVGIIESPYFWNEKTQNALMSSPKGDPFWFDTFDRLIQNHDRENILEVSGPILMDQAIKQSEHPVYILPCENFQRVPLGEYTETIPDIIVSREELYRFKPFKGKHCGLYFDDRCHFGKHHNTVSYVKRTEGGGIK